MSVDKFKFISPGIFVNEIDNTGRNSIPSDIGPALIGRSEKGPILQPTQINSFADFVNIFGMPIPGGKGGDVVRDGNYTSPTYAAYAAQAWLRNNPTITYIRLGGQASSEATGDSGKAGWKLTNTDPTSNAISNGGAWGLFVANKPSASTDQGSGTLQAVSGVMGLIGATPAAKAGPAGGGMAHEDGITVLLGSGSAQTLYFTITASVMQTKSPNLATAFGFTTGSADADNETSGLVNNGLINNITASFNLAAAAADPPNLVQAFSGTGDIGATTIGNGCVIFRPIPDNQTVSLPFITVAVSGAGGVKTMVLTGSNDAGVGANVFANGANTGSNIYDYATDGNGVATSGTLAAVWYIDKSASIGLSGTYSSNPATLKCGTSIYVDSVASKTWKVRISGATGDETAGVVVDSKFNFSDTNDAFVRKTFNTNPILTNSDATATDSESFARYWLGESYEGAVLSGENKLDSTSAQIGVILPLLSGTARTGGDFRKDYQNSRTGWFISQDLETGETTGSFDAGSQQKLFKLIARNSGRWTSRNLKISIKDLKRSTDPFNKYGTFTVAIRGLDDTDNRVSIVEQFNNCNLNPNSEDFIGRKIGDKFLSWDDTDRRYKEIGDYPNSSRYVRVSLPEAVKRGDTDPEYLPFGVFGPLRFKGFNDISSSSGLGSTGSSHGNVSPDFNTFVSGGIDSLGSLVFGDAGAYANISGAIGGKIMFKFPRLRLRVSASEGNPVDPRGVYFGVDTSFDSSRLNESVRDHLKVLPADVSDETAGSGGPTENSFVFTLDDIMNTSTALTGTNVYVSGSRQMVPNGATDEGNGIRSSDLTYGRGTGSYAAVIETMGCDRFTTVLHGGFDGLDITEAEPFRQSFIVDGASKTNYAYNSLQVAIDTLRDPEVVEYNLASIPGVRENSLNTSLINMCEDRGDAMAVIDLKGGYVPKYERTTDITSTGDSNLGDVDTTVNNLRNNMVINSSYGAAYYPWVQIRDVNNGQLVWVPPSVAAIGAMSFGQRSSELWFAPAGFTRGGLSTGAAGLPVVAVRERLTSKQRDRLYDANINPIAQFPAEGIVIFGQKTLQVTPSALDRINVRRLLIFLKRQISRFAATVLFDQNVRATWNRFRSRVEPFLASVQARLGITNFKLVLDETTTTQDLIDRNIMYAKIFIKPARAIEYIALDFILTDNGAAFED
tara:strand:- start:29231 stop:32779 length:3549 start_codon:yes stop_codon:yes gene_type:complete